MGDDNESNLWPSSRRDLLMKKFSVLPQYLSICINKNNNDHHIILNNMC